MSKISLLKVASGLLVVATCFVAAATAGSTAADPTGKWTYEAQVQDRTVASTLELVLDGQNLSGTVENRLGKVAIRDARYDDGRIAFSVVRKVRRRTFTANYTGTLEGDTITGSIVATNGKDKQRSVEWKATRAE